MFRHASQLRHLYRARCKFSQFLNCKRQHVLCVRNFNLKDTHRCLASLAPNYQEPTYERERVDYVTVESIDEALSKMDQNAKRFGHITSFQVKSAYNNIKTLGKVSSIQSLYLLRCCGALMCNECLEKRTQLADEIWKTMEDFKVPVDASHYNALMKVYLENEHKFSPTDFLSNMEKNRVQPNRVTYQRLIEKYCQDGDLNGASVILEHMKEKGIAVTEAVFNSLIKGHAKTGDFEGAKSMFEVMRRSQLLPSSSTYLTLACGYAEKGDVEGVISTLHEAKQNTIYIGNADLLSVIYTLIVSGHEDQVGKIFDLLEDVRSCRKECVNLIHRLMGKGFHKEAYTFLKQISSCVDFSVGATEYIKHSVSMGRPVEEVIKRCQELSQMNMDSQFLYLIAAKSALDHNQEDCAMKLFKEFLKLGIPVRSHYFWPFLAVHRNAKNEKGLFDVLKAMSSMGVLADFDTYIDYIFPSIATDDADAVINSVKETGQSEYAAIPPLFKHYCRYGNYKNAVYLYENNNLENKNFKSLLIDIAEGYNARQADNENLVKLLKHLSLVPMPEKELIKEEFKARKDAVGYTFLLLSNSGKLTKALLTEAYNSGLGFSNQSGNVICDSIGRSNPELLQIVRSIQYNAPLPQSMKDQNYLHPRELDIEDAEKLVLKLRESGMTTRVALRHLFVEYCKTKNLSKLLEVKQELDNDGFQYTPAMYALMIEALVALHDLDRAKEILDKLKEEYPDCKLDNVKAINYAILLIRSGKHQDAIEFLKDECSDINFSQKELLLRNVKKLLNIAAETEDPDLTNEVFQVFSDKLDISTPQYMLESLIKVHLNKGDVEMAIQEYIRCLKQYNFAPCRFMLFKKFISLNDLESLQRVVDATAMVNGRFPTLHELAMCFIECGQIQEARKVFQNIGDRVDFVHLEKFSGRLVKERKTLELENLISATKGLMHIDRDRMYYHLLTLYVQDNDCERALELWNCIQEENIHPSPRTLHTLANLLMKNDQPIPFVVPGEKAQTNDDMSNGELTSEGENFTSDLQNCVRFQDINRIMETLNKMKKGHVRLLPTELLIKIVDLMLQNDKLKDISQHVQMMSYILEKSRNIFRPLMEKYAETGNTAVFMQMMQVLPDFALKSIGFNFFFNRAHIVSGKTEELMLALEKNVGSNIKLFSLYGFMELLKASSEFERRAITLVDQYVKVENFDIPRRALWVYYFTNERFTEAEQLFREYPELFTGMDILASQTFRSIKKTNNETVARKFLEFLSEFNMKSMLKDRAYSCLFDVLVNKADHEAAVQLLEEAQTNNIPTARFSRKSLLALKTQLESNNKHVPFQIAETDDGNDDDSSSSDSE